MFLLVWSLSAATLPPRTHRVGGLESAELPVSGGVSLYTTWRLPSGSGPFPTVVTRSPYPLDSVLDGQCRVLVARGFACLWQDVRGRGRSGGKWVPFVHEEADGQDLVRWVSSQPWSNQKIAWIGDSYLAAAGWTVGMEAPDGVTTLISRMFAPGGYSSAYEGGLLRHELLTAWMAIMPDERDDMLAARRYHDSLARRPRTEMDLIAAGREVPWFRAWLAADTPDAPLWTSGDGLRLARAPETTDLPIFMVAGWSDAFIDEQLRAWPRLARHDEGLLVVGPWSHLGQAPSEFPLPGAYSQGSMFQLPRVIDWLDVHLRGGPARPELRGAVTYVVGGGRWETRTDWPPPTRERRFYAVTSGAEDDAVAARCSGRLEDAPAAAVHPASWRYNPEDPLPSRGGAGLLAGAVPIMNGVPPGFMMIPDPCVGREDLLRFVSAPLTHPLHFAGFPRVELDVSSDADDSAFGFRLLERRPNGEEFILREGFLILSLRGGGSRMAYTPGETVSLSVDSAPLEAELQPGSAVVLVITSSSFPAYEAHPNVAGLVAAARETRVARQTLARAVLILPEVVP